MKLRPIRPLELDSANEISSTLLAQFVGAIVIVDTGDCSPQDKIRVVQQYDAIVSLWGDWPILMGRSAKCQKHNFNLLNIILCVRTYIDALSAGGRIP
jgi:hypothetical protein